LEGLDLFWSSLTSLRRADIGVSFSLPSPVFTAIPSELISLRLGPYAFRDLARWDQGEQLLQNSPPCMQGLQELRLPPCQNDALKERIDGLCAERGITLEYTPRSVSFLAQWEDAMT
jgi:hypothetical protein